MSERWRPEDYEKSTENDEMESKHPRVEHGERTYTIN